MYIVYILEKGLVLTIKINDRSALNKKKKKKNWPGDEISFSTFQG